MCGIGLVGRIEEADRNRFTLSPTLSQGRGSKSRKTSERLVAAAKRDLRRQFSEVPAHDALALHARLRLGERQARGLAQAPAQLAEIAAHRELALRLVDDAHVHDEVRG